MRKQAGLSQRTGLLAGIVLTRNAHVPLFLTALLAAGEIAVLESLLCGTAVMLVTTTIVVGDNQLRESTVQRDY